MVWAESKGTEGIHNESVIYKYSTSAFSNVFPHSPTHSQVKSYLAIDFQGCDVWRRHILWRRLREAPEGPQNSCQLSTFALT